MIDFPLKVQIEPTNYCNLTCPKCPTRHMTYPKGVMEGEVFTAAINDVIAARKSGCKVVVKLFFLGEPLMHPDFDAMLIDAATHGVPVAVVTNGTLLTERQIDILNRYAFSWAISIDGADAVSYKRERPNGNYAQLRKYVQVAASRQQFENFGLTTVMPDDGYSEYLSRFIKEWKCFNGLKVTGLQLQHHEQSWKLPERKYVCPDGLDTLIVRWNGNITYCCGDINTETILGIVPKDRLADVWKSRELKKVHASIKQKKFLYACRKCPVYHQGYSGKPLIISMEDYKFLTDAMKANMKKEKIEV